MNPFSAGLPERRNALDKGTATDIVGYRFASAEAPQSCVSEALV
jgi:hypothetical protein